MKELLYTVLLILLTISLEAQKNDNTIIVMESGSIVEGEIIEWKGDESLTIKCKGIINPVVVDRNKILRVFTNGQIDTLLLNEKAKGLRFLSRSVKNNFKESGLYATLKGQMITANDGNRANGVNGYGISLSAGHRYTRMLAIGGGLGYDQYIWDSGEEMIPIFAEVSGFFNNAPTSFFYNLQAGYSFALSDDDFFIENAKGGLTVYPSVGLRMGRGDSKVTLDFGYKIQNATFAYADPWNDTIISEQRLTYRRMTFRLGILLQ